MITVAAMAPAKYGSIVTGLLTACIEVGVGVIAGLVVGVSDGFVVGVGAIVGFGVGAAVDCGVITDMSMGVG